MVKNPAYRRGLVSAAFMLLMLLPAYAQMPAPSRAFCPVPPVDSTLVRGEAARDNLWPGFGTGSRRQADMASATAFRTADILGFALTGVGAVGITATALQRSVGGQASMFSNRTAAPYFVFGGVALAGVTTVTVSRVLAARKARQYDLILFPAPVPGGAGLALSVTFL
ncbi:MAG: hypothetical protein IJL93_02335 [Bacteroidales bacterium]|nr:hypothetical protein [Bacteroidales bacterium]